MFRVIQSLIDVYWSADIRLIIECSLDDCESILNDRIKQLQDRGLLRLRCYAIKLRYGRMYEITCPEDINIYNDLTCLSDECLHNIREQYETLIKAFSGDDT